MRLAADDVQNVAMRLFFSFRFDFFLSLVRSLVMGTQMLNIMRFMQNSNKNFSVVFSQIQTMAPSIVTAGKIIKTMTNEEFFGFRQFLSVL